MSTFLKEANFNGKNGTHFKESLYYDISQDIANNTSTITYYGYVGSIDGYSGSGSTATVYINGASVGTFSSLSSYSSGTLRGTKTETIYHNSDGTASASYSMSTDTAWTLGDAYLDGSFTLPTIPRASEPSASNPNINIGDYLRINTNRKSGSFTHTITATFGNFSRTWTGVGDYVDWNTNDNANSLYAQIPNSPSGTGTITCTTYNGGTQIGSSKTCNFTLTANRNNVSPVVSLTAVDTNKTLATGNTIQDLTGDSTHKTMIKGISNVQVSLTATARGSASISATQISSGTGEYANYNGNFNYTFQNTSTNSYTGKAVDTRNYDGYAYITSSNLTMLDYTKLSISPVKLYRTNQTGNSLYAEITGNYFNDNIGQNSNTLTLKFKYKESTASWTGSETWTTLTPTITNNTYSFDGLLGSNFDYTKIYDFVFKVEDLAMVQTHETSSTPGIPIIGIFEDFIELWGEVFAYK